MSKKPIPIHLEVFTGNYDSVHVTSLDGESRFQSSTLKRMFFKEINYKSPKWKIVENVEETIARLDGRNDAEQRAIKMFRHLDKRPCNMAEAFACWLIERHGFKESASTVVYV